MRRIEPLRPITRVPRAPQFLRGVIDLHGEIIPVVDLKLRLGLSADESYYDEHARLLIVEVDDQPVGMLTDAVVGIRQLDVTAIEPPPPMVADINGVYLTGVVRWEEQLLIVLDLSRVLTLEEVEAMQHAVVSSQDHNTTLAGHLTSSGPGSHAQQSGGVGTASADFSGTL